MWHLIVVSYTRGHVTYSKATNRSPSCDYVELCKEARRLTVAMNTMTRQHKDKDKKYRWVYRVVNVNDLWKYGLGRL